MKIKGKEEKSYYFFFKTANPDDRTFESTREDSKELFISTIITVLLSIYILNIT